MRAGTNMKEKMTRAASARSAFAALCLGSAALGCASYEAMPLVDQRSASTLIDHKELDGLHVAIRSLADERSTRKHFGRDLADFGYLPMLVLFELDADSRGAYTVRREDLFLVLRDGTRLASVAPESVIEDVGFSHWRSFFAYLFILPGPFVGTSVSNSNAELEADYLAKSLQSVRMSPNLTSYKGVVFFRLDDDASDDWTLDDAFVETSVYREAGKGNTSGIGKRLDFAVHLTN
jgi:hypothetical protein